MKHRIFILAVLCLLLLTACGGGTDTAEITPEPTATPVPTPFVLEVCTGMEGYTIDPTYVGDVETAGLISHLFEGLMKYVPADESAAVTDAQLVSGLAESHTVSDDGLTWRFTIRGDACWSDGQPVTAQNFVYAWRRLLPPAGSGETAHAAAASQLYGVIQNAEAVGSGKADPSALGVTAENDRTLVVTLEKPCSHFLKLCALPCMSPLRQDVIEAYGGDWTDERNIITNGGYTITSWVHDDHMTLTKNPQYYEGDALGPDTIVWNFNDSEVGMTGAFESGGLDFVAGIADGEPISRAGVYYLYLNTSAVQDWRVRGAMLLSIDRDSIAAALGGGATPAVGLIPAKISDSGGSAYVVPSVAAEQPMYAWLSKTYPDYDLNTYEGRCALAKKLYNEARAIGSWYNSYTVYYRFNESAVNRTVAETCRNNWKEVLGLNAEFVLMDDDTYADSLKSRTFGTAYLSWLPDYDDGRSFLEIMRRGGEYNYSVWGDQRYNDALDVIGRATDAAERDALLLAADAMLFEQERFAVCPIYYFGDTYRVSDAITSVTHTPMGYWLFGYAEK